MGPLKNHISSGSLKGIIISLNHLLRTYYSHVMMRYWSLLLGPASSSIHCVLVDSFFTTRDTVYIYIHIYIYVISGLPLQHQKILTTGLFLHKKKNKADYFGTTPRNQFEPLVPVVKKGGNRRPSVTSRHGRH